MRDATGKWIIGFTQYTGFGNAIEAELRAIMLGLKILSQMPQLSQGVIETDSSKAIELILRDDSDHHPLGTIIDNCKYLLSKL